MSLASAAPRRSPTRSKPSPTRIRRLFFRPAVAEGMEAVERLERSLENIRPDRVQRRVERSGSAPHRGKVLPFGIDCRRRFGHGGDDQAGDAAGSEHPTQRLAATELVHAENRQAETGRLRRLPHHPPREIGGEIGPLGREIGDKSQGHRRPLRRAPPADGQHRKRRVAAVTELLRGGEQTRLGGRADPADARQGALRGRLGEPGQAADVGHGRSAGWFRVHRWSPARRRRPVTWQCHGWDGRASWREVVGSIPEGARVIFDNIPAESREDGIRISAELNGLRDGLAGKRLSP